MAAAQYVSINWSEAKLTQIIAMTIKHREAFFVVIAIAPKE